MSDRVDTSVEYVKAAGLNPPFDLPWADPALDQL
jgi:hypothetical protein